ncbi:MAG: hypothetical protein AAGK14_09115, partial [Verrucomicrobiota bacterium]
LGADPLFRQLCRGQESFRARLTPKPWRMGLANPPDRYPWDTPVKESEYRSWEQRYTGVLAGFAVCELVNEYGPAPQDPVIARLLRLHDEHVLNPGQPLA